jgi:hypothetical protein
LPKEVAQGIHFLFHPSTEKKLKLSKKFEPWELRVEGGDFIHFTITFHFQNNGAR